VSFDDKRDTLMVTVLKFLLGKVYFENWALDLKYEGKSVSLYLW
jgi:hypothetical protein